MEESRQLDRLLAGICATSLYVEFVFEHWGVDGAAGDDRPQYRRTGARFDDNPQRSHVLTVT